MQSLAKENFGKFPIRNFWWVKLWKFLFSVFFIVHTINSLVIDMLHVCITHVSMVYMVCMMSINLSEKTLLIAKRWFSITSLTYLLSCIAKEGILANYDLNVSEYIIATHFKLEFISCETWLKFVGYNLVNYQWFTKLVEGFESSFTYKFFFAL